MPITTVFTIIRIDLEVLWLNSGLVSWLMVSNSLLNRWLASRYGI